MFSGGAWVIMLAAESKVVDKSLANGIDSSMYRRIINFQGSNHGRFTIYTFPPPSIPAIWCMVYHGRPVARGCQLD